MINVKLLFSDPRLINAFSTHWLESLTNYFFEHVDATLVENDNVTNIIAETTNIYIMS